MKHSLLERAAKIRFFVTDVDGVLTDGSLYFSNEGEDLKAFNVRDGLGIKWLQDAGISTAIITGRTSNIVLNRAKGLGISHVIQGREDKKTALIEVCQQLGFSLEQTAYIGDDVQDLSAIRSAGFGCTVANGDPLVIQHADWRSDFNGGAGAVRQLAEFILQSQNKLQPLHQQYLS